MEITCVDEGYKPDDNRPHEEKREREGRNVDCGKASDIFGYVKPVSLHDDV